ncbi:MAG: RnfABCDGE type electron transport complex subunit B [Burkholderiales bacterium]
MDNAASLATTIDAVLPQTQCTRCGYAGCAPYAEALAAGAADVNRCPPGGDAVVVALAALTGRPAKPIDPACGTPGPLLVAVIDEPACIGCTLCIDACPVDAIIGAQKRMHAILPSLCSGCELCVAPCPVDCIAMVAAGRAWTPADADAARVRHRARNARVARRAPGRAREAAHASTPAEREAAVAAALARARARRHAAGTKR